MSLLFAIGIGIVAGMRSMTAPALVAWAAYLGWLHLQNSLLAFMGSVAAVIIFTVFALGELVADKLPKTPARTAPVGLIARVITGALSGACVSLSGLTTPWIGAAVGVIGALAGAFAGYNARAALVRGFHVPEYIRTVHEGLLSPAK